MNKMLAKVISCALVGLEGAIVEVEVDISPGLPSFTIVGLPDAAVQEARERVRAAVRNSGYVFPMRRIIVNLAPADLKKAGPAYDLPIAAGILLSSEQLSADVSGTLFLGELSLDGSLRHPMASYLWLPWLARKVWPMLLYLITMPERPPWLKALKSSPSPHWHSWPAIYVVK